jgi:hypothetical protein
MTGGMAAEWKARAWALLIILMVIAPGAQGAAEKNTDWLPNTVAVSYFCKFFPGLCFQGSYSVNSGAQSTVTYVKDTMVGPAGVGNNEAQVTLNATQLCAEAVERGEAVWVQEGNSYVCYPVVVGTNPCLATELPYYAEGICWENKASYDANKCHATGGRWYWGKCNTEAQYQSDVAKAQAAEERAAAEAACFAQGGRYLGPDMVCYASEVEYKAWVCEHEQGNVWTGNKCVTQAQACASIGGAWSDVYGCLFSAEVADLCVMLGYLWIYQDNKCYVVSSAHVPKGLEKFFYVAKTAQEKALTGQYMQMADHLIQSYELEIERRLMSQEENLHRFYQEEIDRLTEELTTRLEEQQMSYEEALKEYRTAYEGLLEVVHVITSRIQAKYYYNRDTSPGEAFSAIRRLLGVQGGQIPDATFTFPRGFPTPIDNGDTWLVRVPVEVNFPRVPIRHGEITFEADVLVYAISTDGGKTYSISHMPIDFVGGGNRHDKATFNLAFQVEKSGGNYDLALYVGLMYVEHYIFGYVYELESYKEGQPLERRFFTSNIPVGASPAQISTINAQQAAGASGAQPSGAAGFYNWVAEHGSQAQGAATAFDSETGFGLGLLLKYWYIVAAAVALIVAYLVGWLDFIPFVRKRRQKKDEDDLGLGSLDLGDDLMGGV